MDLTAPVTVREAPRVWTQEDTSDTEDQMLRRTLYALAPVAALTLTAAAPALKPGDALLIPRLQAHFDSVVVELRAADVGALTPAQLERRGALVTRLRRYRDRSLFPHNYDFPGQRIPYFVDPQTGTLCAVAHLLAFTGRRDIVNRVATMNNNVWVVALAGDTQFREWLAYNGLTLEEAARIQVPYEFGPDPAPAPAPATRTRASFGTAANLGVAGMAAINVFTNRDGHGRVRNWLGIASGIGNVVVGTGMIRSEQQTRTSGYVNVGLGALGTALSTRAMFRHRAALASRRGTTSPRVSIAPVLPTSESGTGVSLNVTF